VLITLHGMEQGRKFRKVLVSIMKRC